MIDNDNIIKDKMYLWKGKCFINRDESNQMQKQALVQGKEIYDNQKALYSSFQIFMNSTHQKLDLFYVWIFVFFHFHVVEWNSKLNW